MLGGSLLPRCPHTRTAIARFMYECDLPFVHADHPAFKRMIKAVAQAGPTFQPPDAEVKSPYPKP